MPAARFRMGRLEFIWWLAVAASVACLTAATLYREPPTTGDISRGAPVDLGLMPTNSPNIMDVLSVGPGQTAVWATLTNFVRVWSGTSGGIVVPVGNPVFMPPNNSAASLPTSDSAGATRVPVSRKTVIQNLFVVTSLAPGIGKTNQIVVMTNGQPSSVMAQIIGTATTGNNTLNSVVVSEGSEIGVKIVTASGSTAGKIAWSFEGR